MRRSGFPLSACRFLGLYSFAFPDSKFKSQWRIAVNEAVVFLILLFCVDYSFVLNSIQSMTTILLEIYPWFKERCDSNWFKVRFHCRLERRPWMDPMEYHSWCNDAETGVTPWASRVNEEKEYAQSLTRNSLALDNTTSFPLRSTSSSALDFSLPGFQTAHFGTGRLPPRVTSTSLLPCASRCQTFATRGAP